MTEEEMYMRQVREREWDMLEAIIEEKGLDVHRPLTVIPEPWYFDAKTADPKQVYMMCDGMWPDFNIAINGEWVYLMTAKSIKLW